MSPRNILTSSAVLLTSAALTGALTLAGAGAANAAGGDRHSDSDRSVTNGSGDADAEARANDHGRLITKTAADGRDAAGPLGADATVRTTGRAKAKVTKRVSVADGTYRVVIDYKGLRGSERDRGSNSEAEAVRESSAQFVSQTGGGNRKVTRVQQVPRTKQGDKTTLVIKVPNNESGILRVKALLRSTSDASGSGSKAHAEARTSAVTFKINRI